MTQTLPSSSAFMADMNTESPMSWESFLTSSMALSSSTLRFSSPVEASTRRRLVRLTSWAYSYLPSSPPE